MSLDRIAVVGTGVAGSFLLNRLDDRGYDVQGFERHREDDFKAVCAWGTNGVMIQRYADAAGLDFDDYKMFQAEEVVVDIGDEQVPVGIDEFCTFHKSDFLQDMVADVPVKHGTTVNDRNVGEILDDFDLVVDCTGPSRALLPDVKKDTLVPTYEHMVEYPDGQTPFDDFYVRPSETLGGYLWYFPLEGNRAHVGAGDHFKHPRERLEPFMDEHGGEIVDTYGERVRLVSPHRCLPFFAHDEQVVGCGEAIGTVFAYVGEGILPSLRCSEVLMDHLDPQDGLDAAGYEAAVLDEFRDFHRAYLAVKAAMNDRPWATMYHYFLNGRFEYGLRPSLPKGWKILMAAWRENRSFWDEVRVGTKS